MPEECGECREGGRVLEQEPVAAFIAVQLGTADARCDAGAVAGRCDPVVVTVADQGRAGDRAEAVPHVMAFARLELGRAGGHRHRVLLILPGGGQPLSDRPIDGVGLQPGWFQRLSASFSSAATRCPGGRSSSSCSG